MAIENARDVYTRRQEGQSIWVVPAGAISSSQPDDAAMLFDPADDKTYRHPTFYTMPEGATDIAVLRVVVREGFSADLARALRDDLTTVLNSLDELKPEGHFDEQQPFSH